MSDSKRKLALVFGVSEYPEGIHDLPKCANDVEAVREALEDIGFSVYPKQKEKSLNPFSSDMVSYSSEFLGEIKSNTTEIVLFYFTGHGFTHDSNLLLIPYFKGKLETMADYGLLFEANCFDFKNQIFNKGSLIDHPKIKKVFILDCCRTEFVFGTEVKKVYMDPQVMQTQFEKTNTIFSYACLDGREADADIFPNYSNYTKYFLDYLEEDNLAIETLLANITGKMLEKGKQKPTQIGTCPSFSLYDSQSEESFYDKIQKYISRIDFRGHLRTFKGSKYLGGNVHLLFCSGSQYKDVMLLARVLIDEIPKSVVSEKLIIGSPSCKNAEKLIESIGRSLKIDASIDKKESILEIVNKLKKKNQVILIEDPEKLMANFDNTAGTELEKLSHFFHELKEKIDELKPKFSLYVFFLHPGKYSDKKENLDKLCKTLEIKEDAQFNLKEAHVVKDFYKWVEKYLDELKEAFFREGKSHDSFSLMDTWLKEEDDEACKDFIQDNDLDTDSYYNFIESFLYYLDLDIRGSSCLGKVR